MVAELASQGLDVYLIDICSLITAADMLDNLHLNDPGHLKPKNAVMPVISA